MQQKDSFSSDNNIKPDDSSFLGKANLKSERGYWTRYKEPVYPFSQVLRFRVLQVVCGIIMMVMGSVACIEEKGAVTNLGLGVFAGLATVIASAACIHTSRGFGGYRQPANSNSLFRFLGPTLHVASFLTCFWIASGCLNIILLTRSLWTIINEDAVSETSYLLALVQGSLSTSILLSVIFVARLDCIYDPD